VQQLIGAVELLYAAEDERAGCEFRQEPHCRRLANLVDKCALFRELIAEPVVLGEIAQVLGVQYGLDAG
jgi:hypothetical protein